jgi:hypothetical protein
MVIRTTYKNTISMTLEEGDLFAKSGAVLEVRDLNTDKVLGFIDGVFFESGRYIRTANDGESAFYVCRFIRDSY